MSFDIRSGDFTFKHEISEKPKIDAGDFVDHYHTCYELLYIISGDVELEIQHKRFQIKPQSLLVIRPGERHHIVIRSNLPYDRIVIRFDANDIDKTIRKGLTDLKNVYYVKNSAISKNLMSIEQMAFELDEKYKLQAFISFLQILLSQLYSSAYLSQRADYVDEPMRHLMHYIDNNLTKIESIDDLCEELHMSRSSIHKIFNKHSSMPIMSYIRTKKILLAHQLLNEGMSATDVSNYCGFNNYSSFYRAYMNQFNKAPTKVKKK